MPPLELDGLTKYYGDVRGVEDLSFAVDSGEVFGFLGPNGAGKTTAIRTLMGFQSPTAGTARVLGADITDADALRRARANVGFLSSEPSFDDRVTGRRILEYHAGLRGDVRSDELLDLFDPPLDRNVGEYSRGNRQMLAIVIAFMHDPDLVIMDEPTAGLDPLKQEAFNEFVRDERDRGTTVFFSSHVLSEVRRVCDRVGILRAGSLVELENVDALLHRSGKHVRVHASGAAVAEITALDGVIRPERFAEGVQFIYAGDVNALLRELATHEIQDVELGEPPIEDVFTHYYGSRAGADEGDGGEQKGDEPDGTGEDDV